MPHRYLARWSLRGGLLACVFLISVLGLYECGWIAPRLGWWLITGRPEPPASAWHVFSVANHTGETLSIHAELLNDRRYDKRSLFTRQFYERLGYLASQTKVVEPGSSVELRLPSQTSPELSVALLSVRTERRGMGRQRIQGLALYLFSWPWEDGRPMWRDEHGEVAGRYSVAVEDADLVWLTSDFMESPDLSSTVHVQGDLGGQAESIAE